MAVNEYTYGTVALVHDRIGWVVPGRAAFGASTIPTDTEVETILDSIASEIHAALLENGYPAATKASITTNAPRAVSWLERLNVAGACAEILQSFAIAGDPESGTDYPSSFWKKVYENGKKLIAGVFLARMGLSKSYELSDMLVSTSYQDTNGVVKEPFFKKRMWEYPGSTVDEEDDD